jgi:hypothetical protein
MTLRALIVDRPPPVPFTVARPGVTDRLRWSNLAIALVHLVQALIVLAVAAGNVETISRTGASAPVLNLSVGSALAVVFVVLAATHGAAGSVLTEVYLRDLRRGRNSIRWAGMYLTAPTLMVLVALLAGIQDVPRLALVVAATVAMVGLGSMQEQLNPLGRRETTMVPLIAAVVVGLVPWAMVLGAFLAADQHELAGSTFVALFVLWGSVWVNAVLQYRQIGPWSDFLYGERTALTLSLVVNSALAWEIVVAGAMR